MRKLLRVTPLALCGILCLGFQSIRPVELTSKAYAEIISMPEIAGSRVKIKCQVIESDGSEFMFSPITTQFAVPVSIEQSREFIFPISYEPPHVVSQDDSNIEPSVSPSTPSAFGKDTVGDFLTVTASKNGSLVKITGSLVSKTIDISSRGGGEAFSAGLDVGNAENIVVAPEFQEIRSSIQVCGRPGVQHHIKLIKQQRDLIISFEIEN